MADWEWSFKWWLIRGGRLGVVDWRWLVEGWPVEGWPIGGGRLGVVDWRWLVEGWPVEGG